VDISSRYRKLELKRPAAGRAETAACLSCPLESRATVEERAAHLATVETDRLGFQDTQAKMAIPVAKNPPETRSRSGPGQAAARLLASSAGTEARPVSPNVGQIKGVTDDRAKGVVLATW
jgi:hypothetical protein